MKLIGAGFGRTGTMSLKAAIEELGFGPCYHMTEVFQHPEHIDHWIRAATGQPVDWEQFLGDYNATVDWPACSFYEQLMAAHPDAKVLLSVRDPEKWYESVSKTILSGIKEGRERSDSGADPPDDPFARSMMKWGRMVDLVIWQGSFGGQMEDRARAIEIFNAHNAAVQRKVPPERLLVFDVKQGWGPLCEFLGISVPEGKPFPHLNDTAAFLDRREQRRRGLQ